MTVRVIDRLRYDDATATEIASFNNGQPPSSRGRRSEALFKTPGGRYFLRVRRPRRTYATGPGPQRFIVAEPAAAIDWLISNNFTTELNAEFPVVNA